MRFQTVLPWVLEDVGNISSRNAATLPNGIKAASLAVRYNSSGAIRLCRVDRTEALSRLASWH